MLPTLHPLEKTSIELRRAINRLHIFRDSKPYDKHVAQIDKILEKLQEARLEIPQELRDTDVSN